MTSRVMVEVWCAKMDGLFLYNGKYKEKNVSFQKRFGDLMHGGGQYFMGGIGADPRLVVYTPKVQV